MSSLTASALRHLEELIYKIKKGMSRAGGSPPELLEFILVRIVRAGERFEGLVIAGVKKLTQYLQYMQRSLATSVMAASLWAGLLFTLALLVIAIVTMAGMPGQ